MSLRQNVDGVGCMALWHGWFVVLHACYPKECLLRLLLPPLVVVAPKHHLAFVLCSHHLDVACGRGTRDKAYVLLAVTNATAHRKLSITHRRAIRCTN